MKRKKPFPAEGKHAMLPLFCRDVLELKDYYDWQWWVWSHLDFQGRRVALRAANGSGKTDRCATPAAVWHAAMFPGSLSVVTSGVKRQVEEQIWPSLRRHGEKLQDNFGFPVETTTDTMRIRVPYQGREYESRIIGFTAKDAGRFEGFHVQGPMRQLLIVVDEAKSVEDPIFEAVERCQPTRLLVQSSPGAAVGAFYKAFTREKHLWNSRVVTAFECPHIKQEWIDLQIEKWGENYPLVRSMIYADWMSDEGELLVCPLHWLEKCMEHPPTLSKGERALGVDVAAGGDENCLAYREGNKVEILEHWRDKDTHNAAMRIAGTVKRLGLRPDEVFLDVGGMGTVFADVLASIGVEVVRVNFGGKAEEDSSFANRGTEMWIRTARAIEKCDLILPEDEDFRGQITTRRYKVLQGGRMILEAKHEMKNRGRPSPDRADAVVLACHGKRQSERFLDRMQFSNPWNKLDGMDGDANLDAASVMDGIDVGG